MGIFWILQSIMRAVFGQIRRISGVDFRVSECHPDRVQNGCETGARRVFGQCGVGVTKVRVGLKMPGMIAQAGWAHIQRSQFTTEYQPPELIRGELAVTAIVGLNTEGCLAKA